MYTSSKPLVNSPVGFNVVSTRKKKQQNERLFSQLDESDANFMIGQNFYQAHVGSKTEVVDMGDSSNNMTDPVQINSPNFEEHTLEENIVSKVRSELNKKMAKVETRFQDAVSTAIEKLSDS